MTSKCRRRMNGREEYVTTEITQRGGRPRRGRRPRNREAQRKEGGSHVTERGQRIPVLERGVPFPWDVGLPDSVYFSPPKQVVASLEPNFWTHSLQIHCNGLSPKTVTLQKDMPIKIYKTQTFNKIFLCFETKHKKHKTQTQIFGLHAQPNPAKPK